MSVKFALGLLVLILAGCAAAVDRRADVRGSRAEDRWPPIGQFVEVDGTRVHAVVTGSGPDLVLIHGASGNVRDWTFDFVDRVKDRYRVIVLDRPGHGYTDRMDGYGGAFQREGESPAEQARLLSRAAAELGVERPVVVGHSYGGAVAMAWGLDHPAAALVVVSGATMPWPGDLGAQYTVLGSALGGALVAPVVAATAGTDRVQGVLASIFEPQSPPEGYVDYVGPGLTLRPASLRANARQVNTLRPHVVTMSERYPGFALPVELVHGDTDEIVPLDVHSQPLSQRLPDARLTVLEGVGHMPHHVAPDAVEDAIDRAAARAGLR
ncbi:alpha/beta fold hydrolase [Roseivivax sediminis]|uniref:Pimeloyl-ACP methyl ester carboxylesterase n=1 Tax=Roseivivax sediminis TaxID=936889 RepID=A0A1I1XIY7_9RHOB|nr:alpha/beta hydrolase [Roseivivax sediminis]SFE07151.1 Pimeloyl-ACP methyl ester carboxylesterase [Roseivivax sediminis]